MKRFLSVILISALSLLLFCPAVPAQEWTLDSCIRYAYDNNLKILQEGLNTQQSQNAVKKDEMNFIPSFNANMSHNMNWGRSVDLKTLEIITNQLSQNTSASIGASVYLLDGLSKLNTLKRDKIDLERSITDVENLKNEISISIAKAYLQILLSRQILEKCNQGLESIVTQAERTDKLVEAGSQPYSSLLEIKAQVASEQVNIVTADNNLKTNTLALMQMLDLQYSPEFSVFAPSDSAIGEMIESYQLNSVESLYADALSLPRIRSAELMVEKSKYDLKLAKGKYYPTISVSASYGTFYSSTSKTPEGDVYSFSEQIRDNINPTLGFGLNIPIFNNLQVKTSVSNAKLELTRKELQLKSKQQELYKEIQQAVLDAESYYKKMLSQKANMDSMEESFRYIEQKFNVGAANSTDYTITKTKMLQAMSDYYQARYQLVFQLKILDFYRGKPITL